MYKTISTLNRVGSINSSATNRVSPTYNNPRPTQVLDSATSEMVNEGQRLLELTRQLHQRVYTTEQRLNMLSDMVQAQQPK